MVETAWKYAIAVTAAFAAATVFRDAIVRVLTDPGMPVAMVAEALR